MPAPFSLRLALSWTLLATLGLWLGIALVLALFPRAAQSIVLLGFVQVAVYALVLALFASAQGVPFSAPLALRRVPPKLWLSALALGFVLQIPATLLSDLVEHFFPTSAAVLAERVARITPHSSLEGAAIFLVVAVLGPCVEELFFRGALFGALRQSHDALATALAVAALFALGHMDARLLLPLFVTALVLGLVRERSGSVWPGVALHGAFNAATLAVVFAGGAADGKPPRMPLATAVLGCVATVLLLLQVLRFASASRARAATAELDRAR
jgi:membrane protease YdiL (CAAX protease family)